MDSLLNWIFVFAINHLKEEIVLFLIFLVVIIAITNMGNKHRFSKWYETSRFLDRLSTKLIVLNLFALVGVIVWAIIAGISFFNR